MNENCVRALLTGLGVKNIDEIIQSNDPKIYYFVGDYMRKHATTGVSFRDAIKKDIRKRLNIPDSVKDEDIKVHSLDIHKVKMH